MGNNKSRMAEDYPSETRIRVNKITTIVLGKQIVQRCGNAGMHRHLNKTGETTLRFLQKAISSIDDADELGADLTNAAFIFAQPGKEFVIEAGDGDWEFYFSEDSNDEIQGCCIPKGRSSSWCSFVGNGYKTSTTWLARYTPFGNSAGAESRVVCCMPESNRIDFIKRIIMG